MGLMAASLTFDSGMAGRCKIERVGYVFAGAETGAQIRGFHNSSFGVQKVPDILF